MQAFSGIRVLDFTHVFAGPFATYQLAIMGAQVIKIESPHSADMMRDSGVDEAQNQLGLGSHYVCNNQGKSAICLNLDSEDGQRIARELILTADVLVENYSTGLSNYGLGAEQAMAINPALIYCEMSGFGSDNDFSGRPAYDAVIQAFSGMMSLNGEAGTEYLRVGPPLIDYGTGAQAAFAIACALFQRQHSGKGQLVQVNMLDAALMMMSPQVASAIQGGRTDERYGNVQTNRPGYSVFACSDDNIMVGAFSLAQHGKLFAALGIDNLIDIPTKFDKHWLAENGVALRDIMLTKFALQSASHWEIFLNDNDVPAARVRDLYDMLSKDQCRRSAHSQHQRYPDQTLSAPIAAFHFAENGPQLDKRCARHGEDSDRVLAELGYSEQQIHQFRKQGVI